MAPVYRWYDQDKKPGAPVIEVEPKTQGGVRKTISHTFNTTFHAIREFKQMLLGDLSKHEGDAYDGTPCMENDLCFHHYLVRRCQEQIYSSSHFVYVK